MIISLKTRMRSGLAAALLSALLAGAFGCASPLSGQQPMSPAPQSPPAQSPAPNPPSTTQTEPAEPAQSLPKPPSSCPVKLTAATVERIVDGDTAVFRLADGTTEKTRFIGIDTPESTKQVEPFGKEASAYTASVLTVGRLVYLEKDAEPRDRYKRLLAYVWLQPPSEISTKELRLKMFNARLAAKGYAQQMTIPPNVKYAEYFRSFVAEARTEDRGLWRQSAPTEKQSEVSAPPPGSPQANSTSATYIGNNNTMRFHYPNCTSVPTIHTEHVVRLASRDRAVSQGYMPCGNCRP